MLRKKLIRFRAYQLSTKLASQIMYMLVGNGLDVMVMFEHTEILEPRESLHNVIATLPIFSIIFLN